MSANDMKVSLPFSVCSCSAQDENYPATRLALHTADSKGWQSPRMPPEYVTWPLELGLAFTGEVHIQQIQLLAHECKIPKKIDVWIGEAASSDAPATSSGRYEVWLGRKVNRVQAQWGRAGQASDRLGWARVGYGGVRLAQEQPQSGKNDSRRHPFGDGQSSDSLGC